MLLLIIMSALYWSCVGSIFVWICTLEVFINSSSSCGQQNFFYWETATVHYLQSVRWPRELRPLMSWHLVGLAVVFTQSLVLIRHGWVGRISLFLAHISWLLSYSLLKLESNKLGAWDGKFSLHPGWWAISEVACKAALCISSWITRFAALSFNENKFFFLLPWD